MTVPDHDPATFASVGLPPPHTHVFKAEFSDNDVMLTSECPDCNRQAIVCPTCLRCSLCAAASDSALDSWRTDE
jgi:hypothetical protein